MAWFVQALEKKGADGNGCGIWHLTANSDEGGGFAIGCEHDHRSAAEAQECEEALIELGKVTGFPHTPKAEREAKAALKDSARAKLTDEERSALGV